MSSLKSFLHKKVLESGDFDFQGFRLNVFHKGKKAAELSMGKTYTYYDIASLTKIVFTTSVMMMLVEEKLLSFHTKVSQILPWYPHKNVKVSQLLNHSAGNEWWEPYYKKIDLQLSVEEKFLQIQRLCREAPLSKTDRALYSDLDFYLLGAIMEKLLQKPLEYIWQHYKEEFFPKSHLHFNRDNEPQYKRHLYAPTEKCPWRKKVIQGEVHDENAWSLGGVAPHAGLFARIEDLSAWALKLRAIHFGKTEFVKTKTLKQFSQRSMKSEKGDWAYGFMVPSKKGSSAGELFSKKSFGHTGFTGTSLWFDPERDLLLCLLSNRVHPSRKNQGFIRLRPKLHDWTLEFIEGKK